MRKIRDFRRFGCGLVLVLAVLAPARADEDIPAYKVLTCNANCPRRVDAKLLDPSTPVYPQVEIHRLAEAMVDISYTIATDGSTKGAVVEQLIGPHDFAENALYAIAQRRYQPATEDGKPVEQNTRTRFTFLIRDADKGARPAVITNYQAATALARNGDAAGEIAALKAIQGQADLNFYERTMVNFALALAQAKTGDFDAALDAARMATILHGQFLDSRARESAIRLRIELEAHAGELAEAFAWFEILKTSVAVAADDPQAQLVAKLHAAIDDRAPLVANAKVPQPPREAVWQHTLLRRNFTFGQTSGALDRFDLRCDQHGIESPVSDKAEWTVPGSWTGCVIYVHGAPGASFEFVESQPPA